MPKINRAMDACAKECVGTHVLIGAAGPRGHGDRMTGAGGSLMESLEQEQRAHFLLQTQSLKACCLHQREFVFVLRQKLPTRTPMNALEILKTLVSKFLL